ncbi:MAG: lysoplasmalogenase family protein [Microthrixaceae bacterium]
MTLVVAVADWLAVARDVRPAEYVLKPATMVALGALLLALDLPGDEVRWWHLAAIACSLAGDVFLMLPASAMDEELSFVGGLGVVSGCARLLHRGHGGAGGGRPVLVVGGLVAVIVSTVGVRIVSGARFHDPRLAIPVPAYIGVIGVMIATSFGTGIAVGIVGAPVRTVGLGHRLDAFRAGLSEQPGAGDGHLSPRPARSGAGAAGHVERSAVLSRAAPGGFGCRADPATIGPTPRRPPCG